jgi:hypothetical protein
MPRSAAIALGLLLFAGAAIAQIPLWIAKTVFRWRLTQGDGVAELPAGPWQFNLQHLLLAMFLWAVALSPLRKVLPPGPIDDLVPPAEALLFLGVFIVGSMLVAVPCIWGDFASTAAIVPLALGWLVYCGVLTGAEFLVSVAIAGHVQPPGSGAIFVFLFLLNVFQCAAVFGTLLIYRTLGFRFVRARPPARNTTGSTYP